MTAESTSFLAAAARIQDVGSAQISYRTFGKGPPLLFIHGWPLTAFTFRQMIGPLAEHFTCYLPDSPGLGESRWTEEHDFSFSGQAQAYVRFVDALGLQSFHLLAHDTGATIARQLALLVGSRASKLVLIGTEIPGHRPPFIPMYQTLTGLPFARPTFQLLLRSAAFRRSSLGLGGCFVDHRLLEGDFHAQFIAPLLADGRKMTGGIRYLRGIDWKLVDGLAQRHKEIKGPVLLIWGEEDPIFPVARAEQMIPQFADCRGLKRVPGAALFVHEEKPEAVSEHALLFLRS